MKRSEKGFFSKILQSKQNRAIIIILEVATLFTVVVLTCAVLSGDLIKKNTEPTQYVPQYIESSTDVSNLYETQLADELSHLWSKRMEIVVELSKLKNPKHFTILHSKYIENKTWERIAVDMDITWRHCYRLHGSALAEFEKIIN